ncbi:MAG: TetR/AcrR family transcriptional regulator [Methylophaga sp.]|nr:TetR/AcrR family transcriptional regulator [Methylophaga sp.]
MGRSPTNTKAKLLETANELIWKSSYGSVSVAEICKCSGVNKGSFYYYFSSKSELAATVMEEAYQMYEPELIKVLSSPVPAIKCFENLASFFYEEQQAALQKYGRVCGCPFASLGSEMAGSEELIRKKVDEIINRQEEVFGKSLQQMIDSGYLPSETNISTTASDLHIFIMGSMMMARIQNDLTGLKSNMESGFIRILGLNRLVAEEELI